MELYEEDISYPDSETSFHFEEVESVRQLPSYWGRTDLSISESLTRIILETPPYGGESDPDSIIRGLEVSLDYLRYDLGSDWRFSGVVFEVTSIDPWAQYARDQTQVRRLRIESDVIEEDPGYLSRLTEHIRNNTAPIWVRITTDETSDRLVGKYIVWNLSQIVVWFEKRIFTDKQLTMIVGEEELHPGVRIRKVYPSDHRVTYSGTDCIFVCLNEFFGRLNQDPLEIRRKIWPDLSGMELINRPIHTTRHINFVCREYDAHLKVYDIALKRWFGYNRNGSHVVKVCKLGTVMGIAESISRVEDSDEIDTEHEKVCWAYYDFETVQRSGDLGQRVYAFSFLSETKNIVICHSDVGLVEKIFVHEIVDYLGSETKTTYLCAWNGSRFDARIAVPLIKKSGLWVGHIIVNSANELLSAVIKSGDKGTIILRDPCKMFPGSLQEMAETFGVDLEKGDLNHVEVESAYVRGGDFWKGYVEEKRSEIQTYVRRDSLILKRVVTEIRKLYEIPIDGKVVSFGSCFTRSMAANSLWSKFHDEEALRYLSEIPSGPYDSISTEKGIVDLSDILKDLLAARCEAPLGKYHCQNAIIVDAKSMYPSRAALDWYPCGRIKGVASYVPEKLGMYEVVIERQNYPSVVPHRSDKRHAYDWRSNSVVVKWVTSVDVGELIENRSNFSVLRGFVWEGRTKKYFESFMKKLYDLRMSEKDEALNLHFKILMNALLGGLIQDQFREYVSIMTPKALDDMKKKYHQVVSVISAYDCGGGHLMCTFKPLKLKSCEKDLIDLQRRACKGAIVVRPGLLTWFVLSYSRRELRRVWREVEDPSRGCHVIYCDTDSLVFTNSDFAKSRMKDMGIVGTDLGKWEIEMENAECYVIKPKIYGVRAGAKEKVRVKGVKRASYCRTSTDEQVSTKDTGRMRSADTFDSKSRIYEEIVKNTRLKRDNLGPKFEHVRDMYHGKSLDVVDFQMHKEMGGIVKKYVVKHVDV
jgi:hypothetical protein